MMDLIVAVVAALRCFSNGGHKWSVASGYVPSCVECHKQHPDGELIMHWLQLMESITREQTIKETTDVLVGGIMKSAEGAPKAEPAPKVITRKKIRDDLH